MIRVLITDDHPIFRQGIKLVLSEAADIQVLGEASSGHEALALLRRERYDVITLDVSMEGKDGLETLKEIRYEKIPVAVLMLSIHPEDQFALRAIKAGANGYLSKTSVPDELITAIREIAGGGQYITKATASKMVHEIQRPDPTVPPHEHLSDREFQVFLRLASGESVSVVAQNLNISVKTASTHRAHILEKMGLENNAQLIRYALDCHLIN